ncbi:MAG TPA: VCBS repeat-containing protein [Gemmatimonadaceae bacterium]|nr:VCBS repeat-containing protein [Gemmatimonadaceae bacterium]
MMRKGGQHFMNSALSLRLCYLLPAFYLAAACGGNEKKQEIASGRTAAPPVDGRLFTLLPSSYTGVSFENRVEATPELNVFTYRNFYNGGGVAAGDLNGDGLPEVMLTSNQHGNKLYLNKGHFQFQDITDEAGVGGKGSWATGVTFADVNGDSLLDIYVCYAGNIAGKRRANELYINQGLDANGIPTFKEEAAQYGLADEGYSTQATFLDYDRDGNLDMFLVENSYRPANSFGIRNIRNIRDKLGGQKLFHNDGNGHFTDVSAKAGIFGGEIAFGLGVVVSDVNRDGWPDIYVSNDFFERDYLYINNHDGTFDERLDREMPYLSYFSMGLDIADINNDGWPDIYTTDMLPEDEYRLRTTSTFEGWDTYQAKVKNGFHFQLMRNMLQLNNGNGTFSDIGQMAGVARTDWSWSALLADLDLDGYKDIYVTNGLARDVTSQDYVAFLANQQTTLTANKGKKVDYKALTDATTSTKLEHYVFRNKGDLTFTNETANWGLDKPSFGNGATYADLDGDGALELVVNNVDDTAFIYRNNARTLLSANHYLQVKLDGEGHNRFGIGSKVTLQNGKQTLYQELSPTRGFQSSVDYILTFGLGKIDTVQTVIVTWPDGRVSNVKNVAANQRITVKQSESAKGIVAPLQPVRPLVTDVTQQTTFPFVHHENDYVDFDRERLMPKMLSTEGPLMAVADVNGDGLDDIFIGGAKDQPSAILIQQPDGGFVKSNEQLLAQDALSEDIGAVFFDANGDGHPDLYVVTGGTEFSDAASPLEDRLYLNDGKGNFRKAVGALPPLALSGSRVAAADFDGDGAIDLFVGGRSVPGRYGIDPQSVLLRNDGRGKFTDVTDKAAPGLSHIGMVTDAMWKDIDGDGRPDLIVVGEWMPITIFHNAGHGKLEKMNVPGLEKSNGWWNRIIAGDFAGHGRVDFIVGNLGLNTRLQAKEKEPVTMYVKDFAHNGFVQQIVSYYNNGKQYPLALRDDLLRSLSFLQDRYPNYKDYAKQTVADVIPQKDLTDAVVKNAYTFATSLARNNGDGTFTLVPLPLEAQIAPMYGILAADIDGDGKADLLMAGNFDGVKPEIGKMSAGYGLYLRGDGKGHFTPVRELESGFFVPGQARDIQRVRTRKGSVYIVSRNNDRPFIFRASAAAAGADSKR